MNALLPMQQCTPAQTSLGTRSWLAVVSHLDPRYGGLSAAVPQLGLSMVNQGFEVSLAAFCAPGEIFRPAGYEEEHLSFWPTSRRRWIESRALRQEFTAKVCSVDGLHIHGLWEMSTAMACRTALRAQRPYVLSAHGMLEPWALANKGWKKRVYAALIERANVERAACLHALTAAEARQYRDFGAKGPIAVVPNAVQIPQRLSPQRFLEQYPALRDRRVILFLGRLHPKKGLDLLAEAWLQLWRDYPDAVLVLAGPDSAGTRAALGARLASGGAEPSVVFAGMLDEPMKWSALAAAECFVLPSFSEGLSMSVLEALGAGVPVLITHACNMPEVSRHEAGWVIEPEVGTIAAALRQVLERGPEANRITGDRGRGLIASSYSPCRVAEQMAAVYEFALTGRESGGVEIQRGTRQ